MSQPLGGGWNNGKVSGARCLSRAAAGSFAPQNGEATLDRRSARNADALSRPPPSGREMPAGEASWPVHLGKRSATVCRSWCREQGGGIHCGKAGEDISRCQHEERAGKRKFYQMLNVVLPLPRPRIMRCHACKHAPMCAEDPRVMRAMASVRRCVLEPHGVNQIVEWLKFAPEGVKFQCYGMFGISGRRINVLRTIVCDSN